MIEQEAPAEVMSTVEPSHDKKVWSDRFREPLARELVGALGKQIGGVTDHVRGRRITLGATETVAWCGVWKWTLVFQGEGEARPWAYIVPDPAKVVLTLVLPDEMITALPLKKLPRFVRDGLAHAPVVDGFRWAKWDLQGKAQADEILVVCEHRPKGTGPAARG